MLNDEEEVVSVSLTTDGGMLKNGQSYVTATGHFVDSQWMLRSLLLGFISEASSQTGNPCDECDYLLVYTCIDLSHHCYNVLRHAIL